VNFKPNNASLAFNLKKTYFINNVVSHSCVALFIAKAVSLKKRSYLFKVERKNK